MTYMLSVGLNCRVQDMAAACAILGKLEALGGEVEDCSLIHVPQRVEDQQVLQATGTDGAGATGGQVVTMAETRQARQRRTPRAVKAGETIEPAGAAPAVPPAAAEGSAGSGTSEAVAAASAAGPAPETSAVGQQQEGSAAATSTPAAAGVAGVDPSADAPQIPAVEEIRAWCTDRVMEDGSRRVALTKILARFGVQTVGALPDDKRVEFFEAVKKELT